MRDHLAAQVAELLTLQAELDHCVRAAGKVDYCSREGLLELMSDGQPGSDMRREQNLIERRESCSETLVSSDRTKRFFERSTEREPAVFGGVVVVNVQVALTLQTQAPPTVLCERVEHVVQESNPRVDSYRLLLGGLSGMAFGCRRGGKKGLEGAAVERDGNLYFGLVGVAVDNCCARCCRHFLSVGVVDG